MKGCKWGKKNLSFLGNWITEKKDDQDGIWLRIRRGSPLSRHYFGLEAEGPDSQQGRESAEGAWLGPSIPELLQGLVVEARGRSLREITW